MQVDVGAHTFDVAVSGPDDAPVVLLLHGFPQSGHSWRLVLPTLLDAGFRVVVPDQRGYSPGARPDDVEDYRIGPLAGDALGILDALGVDRAHVVGHDWGAAVAWQLGARHPERVRTLTAVSVPHPRAFITALRTDDEQRAASTYMRDFATPSYDAVLLADDAARFRSLFGPMPGAVDVEHMLVRAREPGALAAWLRWYAAQRLEDVADTPDVPVPTLHVWSDGDHALRRAGAEGTAACVSGPYRLDVLPGVSHWIPEEAADALGALLVEHLGSALPG
ncbi:alpha/beta hydrolase [Nocardioides sp. KIGAM211]|uniref:Alpha/beta hydrolase n=1 Tax=Nocardioides luti TaxID=2761101 RepID=A0A7X0RHA1_9ACTN|nr:alpha/beta hydrolase [Nocardioides luti]MBB6628172.1 alpha/beta hydrolase [Nocardioides luti]